MAVRAPAVAGSFYPADATELAELVDQLVGSAPAPVPPIDPVAVIAPHAGYRWSGRVAAMAHKALADRRTPIDRVVIAGPTHRVAVNGIGLPSATAFDTPLGGVPIDTGALGKIRDLPGVVVADEWHEREYSLEVQLPFIQHLLGDVPVVPLVIGARTSPDLVADVVERLCDDDHTAVVVSSDLSHHHALADARELDAATGKLVEQLRVREIGAARMCGAGATRGLLKIALRRRLHARILDIRNSGDLGGDPERVVGYGAFAFTEAPAQPIPHEAAETLVALADGAARYRVTEGEPLQVSPTAVAHPSLAEMGAAFVSVFVRGELRGCIGSIEPMMPLAEAVSWAAGAAVEGRGWFAPVSIEDVDELSVEVHVLSGLTRLDVESAEGLTLSLRPGIDGLVIVEGSRRATYLPSVWEKIGDPAAFVSGVLAKGSFDPNWSRHRAAYRYSTRVLGMSGET